VETALGGIAVEVCSEVEKGGNIMFETVATANVPARTRIWTTMCGLAGQALVLTFAVLIPMAFPDALPRVTGLITNVFTFTPPPPDPPKSEATPPAGPVAVVHTQMVGDVLLLPTHIPDKPVILTDPPDAPVWNTRTAVAGPGNWADLKGIGDTWRKVVEIPLAAPAPVAATPPIRVRVGGQVQLPVPIEKTEPVYPEIARRVRVEGTVEIEGVIGTDGRLHELRVLSGNPLLVPAAMDAVRHWVYRPGRLNGEPVEIVTPIKVNFTLR
jgi:periplasmic protein TonB